MRPRRGQPILATKQSFPTCEKDLIVRLLLLVQQILQFMNERLFSVKYNRICHFSI